MSRVDIDGTRLEYVEKGTGEPLVFVHGSASDYRTWQFQLDEFAGQFRVIAYSRRYHWPNDPIPAGADYSMVEHVDDLQRLLRSFHAAPAHLVGHSYGAFLCLLLAVRAPHLVRTLILTEPPVITLFVSSTPKPLELLKLLLSRPRTAAAMIKYISKSAGPASRAFRQGNMEEGIRIFGDAVFGSGGYERLPQARKNQVLDNLTNIKAELLGPGMAPLDTGKVSNVQTPTLLITGERSIDLFHHLADRLEELLPHCERAEIPGASHITHEDNAAAYNAAVLPFIIAHRQQPDNDQES
jgi:pimeloyl-ACP methyl ester carboxylesterase